MDINRIVKQDILTKVYTNRFSEIMTLKKNYCGTFPLIDLGIGEDKSMPDKGIINALMESTYDKDNHKYTDNGLNEYVICAKNYLRHKHGLILDEDQIMPIMGAKSLLAMIPSLFINKGDYIITLKPSYVILERAAQQFDANIYYLELSEENDFGLELESIPFEVLKKTKIMNLNFPHNPTGAILSASDYLKVIELAKEYGFMVINDAAYLDVNYQNITPFLKIPGAKDVGIEIYTMSKAFNMTGFRIGFCAGNSELIRLLKKLKDNYDSGQYAPIQHAAMYALDHPEINHNLVKKYLYRMKKMVQVLQFHGLMTYIPPATFFLYIKVPIKYFKGEIKTAQEFAMYLLSTVGIMSIPYDECGPYIRISVTYETDNEEMFFEELDKRLKIALEKYM